jgi:branched-chain amino acid transport system ATP-binding protein
MLSVEHLSVLYGSIRALDDVSLHIEQGEIVAVLGPNGAGKTTLLRAISRLLTCRGGSITFDGRDLGHAAPHQVVRLGIVQVLQGRQLFGPLSVRENLLLGAHARPAAAVRQDLEWVYGLFPRLVERQRQAAGSLSGGEQQMLAIGRALMARPRLLLLDEPSLGLAPMIVDLIFDVISELNREGLTVLLVEQNAELGLGLARRCYVMAAGRVEAEGPPEAVSATREIAELYLGKVAELRELSL